MNQKNLRKNLIQKNKIKIKRRNREMKRAKKN